ncbi:MAG TPA: lipoprotein signal peptidase [Chitinophagaceae bacterium]|nr:lipoprotein signal peptidase [Chitinophagaceae bacterium]MCC6634420.1 lipoprotein signal peptidase [Chitinophagaceae bacterium]HMZ45581.1 lipoprotein signal peptidase [Chitinophagaceae bacterium]HNE93310.1 lipoprotein signal peptidase [Chitinophagaceae bacterium]HNF29956.1 lipoprotein signal peptidase [Chitinophagaceae bacterium]
MKARNLIILILVVLFADQALKFYIKLNYYTGEEHKVIGNWFRLHFVENEGMAWGWKFGGGFGKIALTLFRLAAVIWGTFLLRDFIKKKYHKWFIVCAALIYIGALGNLIDSMFYGLIFDISYDEYHTHFYGQVAKAFTGVHYGSFLHGKVVDMFYFPLLKGNFPEWMPFWGGEEFEFFRPVFNIADASISVGIITILIFQNKFFNQKQVANTNTVETSTEVNDTTQVL